MHSRNQALLPLNLAMLAFAASALLGVLWAYDPALSVSQLAITLSSVALYLGVANFLPLSALQRLAVLVLVATAAFALYLILQFSYLDYEKGGIIVRVGTLTTLLPDWHGFRPRPNAAATLLEAVVPLGMAVTLSSRGTLPRTVAGAGTAAVLYAILLTASRGAWLALTATAAVAVALVVLRRLPRGRAVIALGSGAAAITLGLGAIAILGPEQLSILASTFARADSRGTLYRNSLYLAGDYAYTGIGLGDTFGMVYSRYSLLIYVPFLFYSHNLPLSVWLNQGLLGLASWGALLTTFYLLVGRVLRRGVSSPLFHGAWLGATSMLLHGLTDAPEYSPGDNWTMPMLLLTVGLAAGFGRLSLAGVVSARGRHLWPAVPAVLVALAVVLISLVVAFRQPLVAAWETNLGAIDETRAELAPGVNVSQQSVLFASAEKRYRAALAIYPDYANASRRLGNLLVKMDRSEEAVPPLEAALRSEAENPATLKGMGLAYVWTGRVEEAAGLFRRLGDGRAMYMELNYWGWYRSSRNEPLLSAYAYDTALAVDPGEARATDWLRIADAYRKAGRITVAQERYGRVLDLDPGNAQAKKALAEMGQ